MNAYSKVSRKPEKSGGVVSIMRSGPALTPSVRQKSKSYSPDQKLILARWLDSLTNEQQRAVFRVKRNKWGVNPATLRRWLREFKQGEVFKKPGSPSCLSDTGFQQVLDRADEKAEGDDAEKAESDDAEKSESDDSPDGDGSPEDADSGGKPEFSLVRAKALIQAQYRKGQEAKDKVFTKPLSRSTMWRLLKGLRNFYTLTPNPEIPLDYRPMDSVRRAVHFFSCAAALHSRLVHPEMLVHADSTQFSYTEGPGGGHFHSPSPKPDLNGARQTLSGPELLTMWTVESYTGSPGPLLFVVKCTDDELPGNQVRVGHISQFSPLWDSLIEDSYVAFAKDTPEHSWVVNGIKLEMILDIVRQSRDLEEGGLEISHLPRFFEMLNERESEGIGTRGRKRRALQFNPLPPTPSPIPEPQFRSVVWVDSEPSFTAFIREKEPQGRCARMMVDIARAGLADLEEDPVDDPRQLLRTLRRLSPDEGLERSVHDMLCSLKVALSPEREGMLCCFLASLKPLLPAAFNFASVQKQFTAAFGPSPLQPSLRMLARQCVAWKFMSKSQRAPFIKQVHRVVEALKCCLGAHSDWEDFSWEELVYMARVLMEEAKQAEREALKAEFASAVSQADPPAKRTKT